jgi:hypothetical protein
MIIGADQGTGKPVSMQAIVTENFRDNCQPRLVEAWKEI